MEQTNTGTVAQMLEEGLAKMADVALADTDEEVQRLVKEQGLTHEQAVAHVAATVSAGVDPAYFAEPYVTSAELLVNKEPELVHPLAVEVSTKMQGLTAEEVLAGLMPELSALYRERDDLLDANARQQTAITFYLQELGRLHKALDTSSDEVSFAYRAGQEVEKTLGQYHADLVRLETNNQLLAQQAGVYKADLQVIHSMLVSLLMRNITDKDAKAAEERADCYYQLTTLELAQEVVFASTSPEQFATNFGSRVAEMRKELERQAVPMTVTDGGANEQNSSTEGLLQGQ